MMSEEEREREGLAWGLRVRLCEVGVGSCDSKQTLRGGRKNERLWQDILKALLGDDWLIAPLVTHSRYTSFTYITIFTSYRPKESAVLLKREEKQK